MIEIEKFPCTDGNESRARERYYFDLLNAKLNKVKPLITEDELKQMNKEYKQKEQYKENQKLYNKQYREEHIDIIKENLKNTEKKIEIKFIKKKQKRLRVFVD